VSFVISHVLFLGHRNAGLAPIFRQRR